MFFNFFIIIYFKYFIPLSAAAKILSMWVHDYPELNIVNIINVSTFKTTSACILAIEVKGNISPTFFTHLDLMFN